MSSVFNNCRSLSRAWLIAAWRCCALLVLAFAGLAQAQDQHEHRLALVIGNSNYRNSPLANPVNDARLMETALKQAGFQVIKAENASLRDTRRLVRDFGDKLKQLGGVGLFYFAGHGVQVRGENYLVSVDSDIRNEDEVAEDALNAQLVLEKMQSAGNRVNLVILDACRNNPFAVRSRSSSAGLATMSAPSGSMVAYSTSPGSVASDGTGQNGLYTQHLAKVISQPGLPVEEVFKQVRTLVRRDSNGQQTPWENTALEGQFFFRPPLQAQVLQIPPPANEPARPLAGSGSNVDPTQLELSFWETVKSSGSIDELESYLKRYPLGVFSDIARARIAALKAAANGKALAAAPVPPTARPAPVASVAPVSSPPTAAPPVVVAPSVTAPTVSAPTVSAPVVSAPTVSAPPVSAPVVPAPVAPALAAAPVIATPIVASAPKPAISFLPVRPANTNNSNTNRPPAAAPAQAPAPVAEEPAASPPEGEIMAGTTRFIGRFAQDADGRSWSGTGKVVWINGDTFEGTLVAGKRQGMGKFSWGEGQYVGDWVDDKAQGHGTLSFKNGNNYVGAVLDGLPNGEGAMRYASGDTYRGSFTNGLPNGRGVFQWGNGQRYEGDWKMDRPQGMGTLRFANGNLYEGAVSDGVPNGEGSMRYASGDVYKGGFRNGVPDGIGVFIWKNGDQYSGQWKAGTKDGEGVFVWGNGDRWEGIFRNDQQTETGKLIRKTM